MRKSGALKKGAVFFAANDLVKLCSQHSGRVRGLEELQEHDVEKLGVNVASFSVWGEFRVSLLAKSTQEYAVLFLITLSEDLYALKALLNADMCVKLFKDAGNKMEACASNTADERQYMYKKLSALVTLVCFEPWNFGKKIFGFPNFDMSAICYFGNMGETIKKRDVDVATKFYEKQRQMLFTLLIWLRQGRNAEPAEILGLY